MKFEVTVTRAGSTRPLIRNKFNTAAAVAARLAQLAERGKSAATGWIIEVHEGCEGMSRSTFREWRMIAD